MDFTFLEDKYIQYDADLFNLLTTALVKNPELWSKKIYEFIRDNASEENFSEENFSDETFLFPFALSTAKYNDDIESLMEMLDYVKGELTDTEKLTIISNQVEAKIDSKLATLQKGEKIYSDQFYALLEKKDYAKINSLVSDNIFGLSNDVLIKIKNEYSFKEYGFPYLLKSYADRFLEAIPYMTLDTLGYLLQNLDKQNENYNLIITTFQTKILQKEELAKVLNFYDVKEGLVKIPYDKEFNTKLVNNHIYLNFLDFVKELEDKETPASKIAALYDQVYEDIKNNKIAYETLKASILYSNSDIKDKRILDYYLDHNEIKVILRLDSYSLKEEYFQEIIKRIDNGNTELKQEIIDLDATGGYPLFRKYLLEHGLCQTISFNFDFNDQEMLNLVIKNIKNNSNLYTQGYELAYKIRYPGFIPILEAIIDSDDIPNFIGIFKTLVSGYQTFSSSAKEEDRERIKNKIIAKINASDELAIKLANAIYVAGFSREFIPEDPRAFLNAIMKKNYISGIAVLNTINHRETFNFMYNMDTYDIVKPYITAKNNIDAAKLDYLVSVKGPKVLRFIDNDSIQDLLKLPQEEIAKILALFPDNNYTLKDLEASYDAIKQYEYSKQNPQVINIFSNIMHSLDDKNNDYQTFLPELLSVMDARFSEKFKNKFDLSQYQSPQEFLEAIIKSIKSDNETKHKYVDLLHTITDYYIERKREEYRSTYNYCRDLKLPYKTSDQDANIYLSDYILRHAKELLISYDTNVSLAKIHFKPHDLATDLYDDILNYMNDKSAKLTNDIALVKKSIKIVRMHILKILADPIQGQKLKWGNYGMFSEILKLGIATGKVKITYFIPEKEIENGADFSEYDALSRLRIDILKDKVLSNESLYQELLEIINTKKVYYLPDCLLDYMHDNTDLHFKNTDFVEFINYYYKIRELEAQRMNSSNSQTNMSLINILKNTGSYASCSSVYKMILGSEDASLIATNAGPNAASRKTKNNERLKEAVTWTIKNFKRQEVTVPPINTTITIGNKKMNCIVGNFTNPCNLTHGERTGACMRIGGVGESLFNFALENENGFHIRFMNPDTGAYVSRVTGFRNGNTVFLNELRYSCDKNYTNEDVVMFCKQVSQLLIDRSKDSTMPIDNVVICRAYATSTMPEKEANLQVSNIKEGLPKFYSDVSEIAIILATSNHGNLVPINFDKNTVPHYSVCRDKITFSSNREDMLTIINRVHAVKSYSQTNSLDNIEPIYLEDDFLYGCGNNDWYIYIDENMQLHSEIIDIDERAYKEYNIAMEHIKKYIDNQNIERGVKHA